MPSGRKEKGVRHPSIIGRARPRRRMGKGDLLVEEGGAQLIRY